MSRETSTRAAMTPQGAGSPCTQLPGPTWAPMSSALLSHGTRRRRRRSSPAWPHVHRERTGVSRETTSALTDMEIAELNGTLWRGAGMGVPGSAVEGILRFAPHPDRGEGRGDLCE